VPLNDEDVREILRLIDSSKLDELRIETPGLSLHVRRGGTEPTVGIDAQAPRPVRATQAQPPLPAAAPPSAATTVVDVQAPMLGTFYRAEAPGAQPFVAVGDHIEAGSVVCMIEVMKLMNHVMTDLAGTVVEVCAEDGQLVEFGQPLLRLAPST
jgi:acetyl-CoA carboxylase biotin carboxyl carrier protein